MQDSLIHTKLHLPFLRAQLVPRQRLQAQVSLGLAGPLCAGVLLAYLPFLEWTWTRQAAADKTDLSQGGDDGL